MSEQRLAFHDPPIPVDLAVLVAERVGYPVAAVRLLSLIHI